MSWTSRRRDYERLERKIKNEYFKSLLTKVREKETFYKRFGNWGDVVSFMRAGTSQDPRKDNVLRPLFHILQDDQDPRCQTILLVIFWPGLESIHRKKRHWDIDMEERWQNLLYTFLMTITKINPKRRSRRLVQKVYNDTVRNLYRDFEKSWNLQHREISIPPDAFEWIFDGVEDIGFALVEHQDEQEVEIRRLRQFVDCGVISEADFYLLVGTRIYGKSLAECSQEVGLGYEAAKKKRQRAAAAIKTRKIS